MSRAESPEQLRALIEADFKRRHAVSCAHPMTECLREEKAGKLVCSECSAPVVLVSP